MVDSYDSEFNYHQDNLNNQKLTRAKRAEYKRIVERVKDVFKEEGEELEDADIGNLKNEKIEHPTFPIIIFTIAIIKDLLDVPMELSVIGIILTTVLSFIMAAVLFLWVLDKSVGGGWWKKKMIRGIWMKFLFASIIEFAPFFKIVPANTIFIWMVHNKEKKIVKLLNIALEEMRVYIKI